MRVARLLRWAPLLLAAPAVAAPVRSARADVTDDCLAASDAGQQQRDKGALIDAKKQLLACARDVCPKVVRRDCDRWLTDVEERVPSVVPSAHDASGADVVDVSVEVDGKVVATKLDGRAIPLDPGAHRFRFVGPDGAATEQQVLVREREKGRILQVELSRPSSAPPAPPAPEPTPTEAVQAPASTPAAAYVLGGIGVLALGSFVYFAISGAGDASHLRSTCAPTCSDASVTDVRRKLLVADVSLGAGVVSLAVAAVLILSRPHTEPSAASAVTLDLAPVGRGGGAAVLSGSF
jgi:hypothetical protein